MEACNSQGMSTDSDVQVLCVQKLNISKVAKNLVRNQGLYITHKLTRIVPCGCIPLYTNHITN